MPNRVTHTIIDASNERSPVTHYLTTIAGANYDAVVGNSPGQGVGDLRLALAGLTLGNFVRHVVTVYSDLPLGTPPPAANPNAQRELRYRFVVQDGATSENYSFEVPCPDLTVGLIPGSDQVDLTDPLIAAFVTAVEALTSPGGGALTVSSCYLVGRNQ